MINRVKNAIGWRTDVPLAPLAEKEKRDTGSLHYNLREEDMKLLEQYGVLDLGDFIVRGEHISERRLPPLERPVYEISEHDLDRLRRASRTRINGAEKTVDATAVRLVGIQI